MIEIKNLTKSFGDVSVLKDINLTINKGEIYGLVGQSGAGKSTLLRCINRLETYNDGSLKVEGKEVKEFSEKEIRNFRKNLGMIFQHFSLLERKTVYENVALPMECWGYPKGKIEARVNELLKIVNLEEKKKSKPRELSGGQKQRVAIARALALEPNILLCDEATSALDPKTTKSILKLLREINEKLGITIVIVTHQMEVVREVCNKVAILEKGEIAAEGYVEELFLHQPKALKSLLGEAEDELLPQEGTNIRIVFPKESSEGSVITSMARELDIDFSIVGGKLEKFRDDVLGALIINIDKNNIDRVKNYLDNKKVVWEVITNDR